MPEFTSEPVTLLLWAALGYLAGSIPFGMVLSRVLGLGNLREIGSGNIGATNVLRTGSKGAAAATLLLDAGKGAVAVILARALAGSDASQLAGLMAFLGHCYPVWLSFRGGKGVATFLGLMLALHWPAGLACCLTWLSAAALGRISSLSAICAALSAPIWLVVMGRADMFVLSIALVLVILWRHRSNIARLRAGTEPRIGQK